MQSFIGTGVALVTPFKKDFSVDVEALTRIVNYVIEGGVEYLVVLGTTAESATLNEEEKNLVIETVIKANKNRLPLVLGVGGNNTYKVVEELKTRDLSPFVAVLSVSPYYNKPTQEGIYQHFKAIAEASPVPVILYNVPGRTGSNMSADTILRLARDSEKFIAVKEASGNMAQVMQILKHKPDHFNVISGDDALTVPLMACGAVGAISVIANALPDTFSQMVDFANNRLFHEANALSNKMLDIHDWLYVEGNPVGVKGAMELLGLCSRDVRLPLVPLSKNALDNLALELKKSDFL